MTTSITWKVQSMLSKPTENVDDFVITAMYKITATDGKSTCSAVQGAQFEYNPSDSYEPYESLTEDQVIAWGKEALGPSTVNAVESSLTEAVAAMSNPPVFPSDKPLPWANS